MLDDFGDPDVLNTEFKLWQHRGSLTHTLRGVAELDHTDLRGNVVSHVATTLVKAGAFPAAAPSHWYHVDDAQLLLAVQALQVLGLVQVEERSLQYCVVRCKNMPAGFYAAFTADAMEPGKLMSQWCLRDPQPILRIRELVPVEDRTAYELYQMLICDHWKWQHLKPKSHRVIGYTPGDDKVFFSSGVSTVPICSYYLLALHRAEDYCVTRFT